MKKTSRKAGISLIEVLIVLVLLLVGIMSVIRLFPPGFLINRQTEESTRASRLAKQQVDFYTNASANLMDSIVPVIWTGNGFQVDANITPDNLSDARSNPPSIWDYYFSNVNRIRRILGEYVRIPLPSPTVAGRGSVYMLSAGPFMDVNWDGQGNRIFVSGAPMIRVYGDSDGDVRQYLRGPAQYAIDYDNAKIGLFPPVNYDRQFLLSYSYYDQNWAVQTVVDQPFPDATQQINGGTPGVIPAGFADWVAITLPAGAKGIVPDSDVLSRRFIEIATDNLGNPARAWSSDPYEFYVASPKLNGTGGIGANVGVLIFNPNGRDYTEQTATGPQPLTARIDYDVLDWRIIREDRPMPATPPYQVPLALKNIKKLNEFNDDQTVYDGLFPGSGEDMIVYNVSIGTRVPVVDPNTQQRNYIVNYKDGTVTFSDSFGTANASGTFRFFYKAQGDWALQIQKAPTSYRRRYDSNLGLNEFYIGGGTNGGQNNRIYLPLSEAGKTVSIRDLRNLDQSGTQYTRSSVALHVNSDPTQFETVGNKTLTWVDVGAPIDIAYGEPVRGFAGISFRARVTWRNGSSVRQDANGPYAQSRWRKIDLDTILVRGSN